MNITATFDKERIAKVVFHPDIWPRIAEDGMTDFEIDPDFFYLMDDDNVGLLIVHPMNSVTYEVHVQVIPEARAKALEFAQAAIEYVWERSSVQKLVGMIPEIYPDVLRFGTKAGFEIEGLNKASYMRNGQIYDQHYVGLQRPEGV